MLGATVSRALTGAFTDGMRAGAFVATTLGGAFCGCPVDGRTGATRHRLILAGGATLGGILFGSRLSVFALGVVALVINPTSRRGLVVCC